MVSSFLGSMIGLFVLLLFTPIISEWGLKFGPADYFAMMVLGLLAASTIGQGSVAKTLAMVVVGMLLGTVGTDVASGVSRLDRKSRRLNSSHVRISYAVFCVKK